MKDGNLGFDEALVRLMPNVDKADRQGRFSEFIKENWVRRHNGNMEGNPEILTEEGQLKEVWDLVDKLRQEGFGEGAFLFVERQFTQWWPEHLSRIRSRAAGGDGEGKGRASKSKPRVANKQSTPEQVAVIEKLRKALVEMSGEVVELKAEVCRLRMSEGKSRANKCKRGLDTTKKT